MHAGWGAAINQKTLGICSDWFGSGKAEKVWGKQNAQGHFTLNVTWIWAESQKGRKGNQHFPKVLGQINAIFGLHTAGISQECFASAVLIHYFLQPAAGSQMWDVH